MLLTQTKISRAKISKGQIFFCKNSCDLCLFTLDIKIYSNIEIKKYHVSKFKYAD